MLQMRMREAVMQLPSVTTLMMHSSRKQDAEGVAWGL